MWSILATKWILGTVAKEENKVCVFALRRDIPSILLINR